jgi:hypothetical protein
MADWPWPFNKKEEPKKPATPPKGKDGKPIPPAPTDPRNNVQKNRDALKDALKGL